MSTNSSYAATAVTVAGSIEVANDAGNALPVTAAPVTLVAEALLLNNSAWTPAAVTGVLTSVSVTVLTGTATVVDSNGTSVGPLPAGTSAAWSVEDRDTLTGPQSITAAAASTALVTWTSR